MKCINGILSTGQGQTSEAVAKQPAEEKQPKQRKRKRGRAGSESETEAHIPEKIPESEKTVAGGCFVFF